MDVQGDSKAVCSAPLMAFLGYLLYAKPMLSLSPQSHFILANALCSIMLVLKLHKIHKEVKQLA